MESVTSKKSSSGNVLSKIRKFGGYMSGMVMPNLGAFVGWGLMAALFIPNGWLPNENLAQMVGPILNYLFPLLIGYTAGYNIHGQRGGVIGAFATMGVIVGADITMISGAMIMGPLSAWVLKKFDSLTEDKIKPGFEMFVNNFSLGILGAFFAIFAFLTIGPSIRALIAILTAGVQWATDNNLIPALSIFMAPAQVLFLNNVVNHGILAPIGYAQAAELGKSIMFLVDTNNGTLLGTLFSIWLFGKGKAKSTAPMAMFIAGIAGIGEVYFPFVLANPILVFATMGGLAVSLFLQVLLGGGLIGVASPGSLINIALMTPKDAIFANFVSILAGFIVSTLLGMILLKFFGSGEDDELVQDFNVGGRKVKTVDSFAAKKVSTKSVDELETLAAPVKKIQVACDSGMGSSAMGATVLKKRLKKQGLAHIEVKNSSANKIDMDTDIVVTLDSLIERARISGKNPNTAYIPINNFLKDEDYDEVLHFIEHREQSLEDSSVLSKELLNEANIILGAEFANEEEAIRASGRILVEQGYVTEKYIADMIERNQHISVYIGNNVAIPHGLEDSQKEIIKTGISIIQVPKGVAFGDGNVANIIVGIAGKNDDHLAIISRLAELFIDENNVEKIRKATTKEEILTLIYQN